MPIFGFSLLTLVHTGAVHIVHKYEEILTTQFKQLHKMTL